MQQTLEEAGLDPAKFEPLAGRFSSRQPFQLLGRHPDGRLGAMGTTTGAAIWDLESGKVVWKSEGVYAISWVANGTEVVLLRIRHMEPEDGWGRPGYDWTNVCEWRSWPAMTLLNMFHVSVEEQGTSLTASPTRRDAAISWVGEDSAGVILFDYTTDSPDTDEATYWSELRMMRGPVFSPDGRWLVLAVSDEYWWLAGGRDREASAPGGPTSLGRVVIVDVERGEVREVEIVEDIPAGWMPADTDNLDLRDFLGLPQFIGPREFRVTLPTGTARTFTTGA